MKNKIKVLLTAIFLITLCSCRNILVKTTVWVMECDHGSFTVTSENEDYEFVVTAKPDEGYCLEEKNLYIRSLSDDRDLDCIKYQKLKDDVYGIRRNSDRETIVVSGIFTEVEDE